MDLNTGGIIFLVGVVVFFIILALLPKVPKEDIKKHTFNEFFWDSNVQTIDHIQDNQVIKHEVVPLYTQDERFEIEERNKKNNRR